MSGNTGRTVFDIHHIFPIALWKSERTDLESVQALLTLVGLDQTGVDKLEGNKLALLNRNGDGLFARMQALPDDAKALLKSIGWGVGEHTNNHKGYSNFIIGQLSKFANLADMNGWSTEESRLAV